MLQWFYTIYTSKYCDEKWETLTYDWTFEQFLEMENLISCQFDLEQATELDGNIEQERMKIHQQNM